MVEGTHDYGQPGNYSVPVSGLPEGIVYATISVGDPLAVASGTALTGVANTPLVSPPHTITVATFTDANSQASASDFLALITWESPAGVPHISSGTVAYAGGSGAISGDYTYEQPGSYPVKVQLFDIAGNEFDATTTPRSTTGA